MKGTIVRCLQDGVEQRYGSEAWRAVLELSGLSPDAAFTPNRQVSDADVSLLLHASAEQLGMSANEIVDFFGTWWACNYAPRVYGFYYERHPNLRSFLRGLNQIHREVTQHSRSAQPPFVDIVEHERRLSITYHSERGLVALFAAIARGLGAHFGEQVEVICESDDQVEVIWAA